MTGDVRGLGRSAVTLATIAIVIATTRTAQAQEPMRIAADIFAGGVPRFSDSKDGENTSDIQEVVGWQLGASIRAGRQLQWLGWTGSYGHYWNDQVRVDEILGGIRVASPWGFSNEIMVRGFGHMLAGAMTSAAASGAQDRAPALVLGGGFDVFLFRMQLDYVHTSVSGVRPDSGRVFIGGVVPLCFRGCREDWKDGIPVSR